MVVCCRNSLSPLSIFVLNMLPCIFNMKTFIKSCIMLVNVLGMINKDLLLIFRTYNLGKATEKGSRMNVLLEGLLMGFKLDILRGTHPHFKAIV